MNRHLLSAIVLLALAAVACSKMCTPKQWSGEQFGTLVDDVMGKSFASLVRIKYVYDAVNQRKAFHYKLTDSTHALEGRILLQYNVKGFVKIYTTNDLFDACQIDILKGKFEEFCIPDNSKSEDVFLGRKGKGFHVRRHTYQVGSEYEFHTTVRTAENGDFIPIAANLNGNPKGAPLAVRLASTFENIVLSVNETDFGIPPRCQPKEAAPPVSMEILQKKEAPLMFKQRMQIVNSLLGI